MISIAIVEDERYERQALSLLISEEIPEAEVVWTSENGADALERQEKQPADILLVDISIPVMDGLAFCEALRMRGDHAVIIINTAYAHFSYAQRALRLGVTEYLVKPATPEEVRSSIEKAISQLRLRRWVESFPLVSQRDFVRELIRDGWDQKPIPVPGWREEASAAAVLVGGDREKVTENSLRTALSSLIHARAAFALAEIESGYLILIQPDMDGSPAAQNALTNYLAYGLYHTMPAISFVRASSACDSLSGLRLAAKGLIANVVPNETGVFPAKTENALLADVYRTHLMWKVRRAISEDKALRARGILRTVWLRNRDASEDVIWEVFSVYLEAVCPILRRGGDFPVEEIPLPDQAQVDAWLSGIYMPAPSELCPESGSMIQQIMDTMQLYYARDLTLDSLAERFGMSPSYFSRYFKEHTGRGFNQTLTDIRIRNAMAMIADDPHITLEQLAANCGFYSKTHFCGVFKKCVGMTVGQYMRRVHS